MKERPGLLHRAYAIARRVVIGCYNDGTIHAGNLAYMSVLAIFPFFITGAAIFSAIGEEADRLAMVNAFASALPPVVADVIGPVARNVVEGRSGWLLWIGGLFGLWTVGSLIETIRYILRSAYGVKSGRAFWQYRLLSAGIIIGAVLLLLLSLMAQVAIGAAQQLIQNYIPAMAGIAGGLSLSRIIPGVGLFGALYMLFIALTPMPYRARQYPKWPGALFVTLWWVLVSVALPPLLSSVLAYDLTYGSLAGFMIALFFFWLVGLGMVAGAELNAALAIPPGETGQK